MEVRKFSKRKRERTDEKKMMKRKENGGKEIRDGA